MGARSFIVVMATLAVVALLGFGLVKSDGGVTVGEPAPDAPLQVFDGDGTATLADYRGQWVLVNFWASWCEPCRSESPVIEEYSREHDGELVVVGMNTEDLSDDAREFIEEFDLSWEMLRDNEGERKDAWGILALPESFLVDPDGNVALIRRGAVDREYLDQFVTPFLDGGTT
ncbi:MAG TPA: TlpA disulfide reductase family protein [Solirubrobacterales bacterium]|nr:TlpA disulfide reductase family protein [Solirubrobacterales bacterium]